MFGSKIPIRNVGAGRKPWLLDLRSVGGKREFYETRALADAARGLKLDELRNHGIESMALTAAERHEFVLARDRLAKIGLTVRSAVEFCEQHHASLEPMLFSKAIEKCISTKQATAKDSEYISKLERHLLSLMASTGDKMLSAVTREEIEKWLFGNGWKPRTIRNHRVDVRTFFRFAEDRRWIVMNPAKKLEPIQLVDQPPGIFRAEEAAAILRAATELEALPYFVLNLLCGLRPKEASRIEPGDIQIERGYVEVRAQISKSRQRRLVELTGNARRWLDLKPVLELPPGPKWYARQIPKVQPGAAKILGRPLCWPKNGLRHSFASYHLAMHGSAEKTALQLGHRSTEMLFRHYRELVTREEAEKFWAIAP